MARSRKPLDSARLEELALRYVGRYATTRAKLKTYLARKLRERGWEGEETPDPEALARRFADLGYIDDAAYAAMKARDLSARGYGPRRLGQALYMAGVDEEEAGEARALADDARVEAALRFARRRRWGPFANEPFNEPQARQKALAAFARAGHGFSLAKAILDLPPGAEPDHETLAEKR